ncbi:MAG TPA: cytochrome b/b6 domain-containing protein [Paracoccaceae bacterium]|nr:cytochrome b/b6 domain-containing protein [Paracoccaceae bacterium]
MSPTGYSRTQISLHWAVAVLVLLQFVLNDGIKAVMRALSRGYEPGSSDQIMAQFHVLAGISIFVLALARLAIRLKRGAPKPPAHEPAYLKLAAHITHIALYAGLLLLPMSGSIAWFGGVEAAGELHEAGTSMLQLFAFLHIGGAIYQHFILKSDVLKRIVKPQKS